MNSIPRVLFAAPGSGSGKTTLTCAFLQALKSRGLSPASFKCGPDYIDPMFHSRVIGIPSRNLDLFFTPEETVRGLLARHAAAHDIAVMEGVMGYYDGIRDTERASTWHLADATRTPVILIVNPKGMSLSLAALVRGFCTFRERHHIAGLLLNQCGEGLYALLKPLLERETGIPVLGFMPPVPGSAFESRHLGLVTAAEIADLQDKLGVLAAQLEQTVDVDAILSLAEGAAPVAGALPAVAAVTAEKPVIAVARDKAFCFYYQDNLDLLEEMGARLAPFSPLRDEALPPAAAALYFGGGYPELYAGALSENRSMRDAVLQAVRAGMPTFAECGGFQYLQAHLTDPQGARHPMVGAIDSESKPTGRLQRFGYITLTAQRDTLLCGAGEQIAAHEFHHWDSEQTGEAFSAQKASGRGGWDCVIAEQNLFAGYPHLYFYSNPAFAENFVRAAERYQSR